MAHILIVDDDPDFCEVMRLVLSKAGHTAKAVPNGDQALASIAEEQPDLIILDIMMQGLLDGLHTAHKLETNEALHRIPVLMVSSITDAPAAGIFPTDDYLPTDAWLSKPVSPDELLAAVDRLLSRPAPQAEAPA